MPGNTKEWAVVAPFFERSDDRWISDFCTDPDLRFRIVVPGREQTSWHHKSSPRTTRSEWLDHLRTANRALGAAGHHGGVVTVFPQLAVAVGLAKRIRRHPAPLVAWFFNTNFHSEKEARAARLALACADRLVVHSTREIEAYAEVLRLPAERFAFVPLQYGGEVADDDEDCDEPFVFATGSGFRDYATMFKAVEVLDLPTKVVASDRVLEGLDVPDNVEVSNHLKGPEIRSLMRRARINVVPLNAEGLTAGLVTVAMTYRHERGLVLTERPGLEDYYADEASLRVPLGDPSAMAEALETLWNDADHRTRLNAAAGRWAEENVTDEAAARNLASILRSV